MSHLSVSVPLTTPAPESAADGVAIVGAGPAGLAAAEVLSAAGVPVDLYDAMPSAGRKFLLAGIGGLNLTHAEPAADFVGRYGEQAATVGHWLADFDATAVRAWAEGLGIGTFVGSSQRVFPTDMKAAPLLRAWLHRLRHPGPGGVPVRFHMRHRWLGWDSSEGSGRQDLRFATPQGERRVPARQLVLALGGGSWARLGSDGAWVPWLRARGVAVADLRPSNCGFDVAATGVHGNSEGWSPRLAQTCAGAPLKGVVLRAPGFERKGECVVTATGLEGSLIYAASAGLREAIERQGQVAITLDLLPGRSEAQLCQLIGQERGARSLSTHLKQRLKLDAARLGLLFEVLPRHTWGDAARVAATLKALPLVLCRPRPLDEAISSAGGVCLEALDPGLMLRGLPGVWCAGEMLDWEAPTGGYLLTACLASGRRAAQGVLAHRSTATQQP